MASQSQVGPSFYNKVNLPIAMLIALLLSLVPYLTWKGDDRRASCCARSSLPVVFAVAVAVGAAVWKVHDPFHLAFVLLAALALATNLQKTVEKFRAGGLRGAGRLPGPRRASASSCSASSPRRATTRAPR